MTDNAPAQKPGGFTFEGEWFDMLTEDDLLFAEVRAIEKATKRNMDQLGEEGEATTALQALTWVTIKRRRPTFRFTDLDQLPVKAFGYRAPEAAEDEPVDPTPAAGQASDGEEPAAE